MSLLLLTTAAFTNPTLAPSPTQPCPFPETTSTTLASITAIPGQTLTIYPIPPPVTTAATATTMTGVTGTGDNLSETLPTITATEIDIILLRSPTPRPAANGNGAEAGAETGEIWTTLTYLTTPFLDTTSIPPTNKYIVVPPYPTTTNIHANVNAEPGTGAGGWSSWSSAQQGGLVAGVVIAGMILLGLLWWACLRSRIWVARDVAYGGDLRGNNYKNRSKGTGRGWVYDLAGRR